MAYHSVDQNSVISDDGDDYDDYNTTSHSHHNIAHTSPTSTFHRLRPPQGSELDLSRHTVNERSGLLDNATGPARSYKSLPGTTPGTPRPYILRHHSSRKRHSRAGSFSHHFSQRLVSALSDRRAALENSVHSAKGAFWKDDRVWYDQFTSTDWVHDSIADAFRVKALRSRKDIRGRLAAWFDGAQGWILVAIIGILTASLAYLVNVTETTLFDWKQGYCSKKWYMNRKTCCDGASICDEWIHWSRRIRMDRLDTTGTQFAAFMLSMIAFAMASSLLTLASKTVIPSTISLSTLDENLGADFLHPDRDEQGRKRSLSPQARFDESASRPPMVYYSAAGSGVAEVKVILSGFVLHGYLGVRTIVIKTLGLILSVASGLSLGKEGPYVHIAACIGNICCRLFSKYSNNDGKRREVLSASAASGVAVAFGAPIGGVLFSLEEVSYYFPPKTLFRTFFCCIAAALTLKFLNPYGTGKIVLFEVRYLTDWKAFELLAFLFTGVLGGVLGALFIKASRIWARTFRRISVIKQYPLLEVFLVALVTACLSFWNRYTKLPVTELLFELASPCDTFTDSGDGLCPTREHIPGVLATLAIAFVIKALLTIITFGIKVPAGIYVPSMVVGGLAGRFVGHSVQLFALHFADSGVFGHCDPTGPPGSCVVPGVYAMVAAGATMTGVTRLTVTLAVILFELTGSLDHVLPFSLGILVAKWTADAIEPLSIYDLLTDMNSYPFLDNKVRPIFTSELGDITGRVRPERIIDITDAPLVPAHELRAKQQYLHVSGEIDGGLPIVRHGVLVGLIPAPDLEFALDKLENEENSLCLMSTDVGWAAGRDNVINSGGQMGGSDDESADPTDFTPYIDPAPVALDVHSPMDLVYECFVKLGLRYICVVRDGRYAGLIHKKAFVKYMKELEESSDVETK
ncbi:voltage-gated protein/chloride channel-like protein [Aaosphaeria arxii CBS 175.79]|uniref:Chloride channel protein n=1 Tax=Aaosphaeria arxii CBS 175.79 TaxID=1450172 RepID=A0A6A5X783_9PLEO|nr:voltage-gated protein/chloride channel-like protein [Aaosphaeria arxii CBS 175.79]KAF2008677.1 voltage-gated protein/chloride channel-like protein [Aaosphaeria arxii CBS 175.79]